MQEAEVYAKVWSLEIGKKFQVTPPRELRNVVYKELVTSPDPINIEGQSTKCD